VSGRTGARPSQIAFDRACAELEPALAGPTRSEILDRMLAEGGPRDALARLRTGLCAHRFATAGGSLDLARFVEPFDRRTRQDGFHVLKEWDHATQRFLDEDVPVLMLDSFGQRHVGALPPRAALALMLDYYLLYVLALVLMRSWEGEDVAANLDRVGGLLGHLHGPQGSGRQFVEDAPGLLFVAVSHYEPDDLAYHRLLDRIWELGPRTRLDIALVAGSIFGCHLRWGFPALYQRKVGLMRDDNFSDYPWVLFSVATLVEEYAAGAADPARRARVVPALLNALTPDPEAFLGEAPAALAEYALEHERARELLHLHKRALAADFELQRPPHDGYSPLSLVFNFPHNVLIATVALALSGARVPNASLSALLAPSGVDASSGAEDLELARLLTSYAAAHPARQGGRPVLMIAHEPAEGVEAWRRTVEALRSAS
jgi:hypothetical protein